MKKSNKCDFKKLALLGIAGGIVLSTEGTADILQENTDLNVSQLLASNACGGQPGGCDSQHGAGSRGNSYQAYRNIPSQDYNYTGSQSNGSCGAAAPQYYQTSSSCHAASSPQYYQQSSPQYYQSSAPQYYQQSSAQYAPQYQNSPSPQGWSNSSMQQANMMNPNMMQDSNMQQQRNLRQDSNMMQQNPSASNQRGAYTQWETEDNKADSSRTNTKILSESELRSQLNDQAKATYDSLDPAGKAMALQMANQDCKGKNTCRGFNSCKTKDHACAGKGSCANTAETNFKDKNLAVKVAALKMAEKRANAAPSQRM